MLTWQSNGGGSGGDHHDTANWRSDGAMEGADVFRLYASSPRDAGGHDSAAMERPSDLGAVREMRRVWPGATSG